MFSNHRELAKVQEVLFIRGPPGSKGAKWSLFTVQEAKSS